MKTKIILLLLTIVISQFTFSQECGTPINKPNLDYGLQRQATQTLNEGPYCVTIKFHIVRQSNGTGGLNPSNLSTIIDNLNEVYNSQNIFITSQGYDLIDDDFKDKLVLLGMMLGDYKQLYSEKRLSNAISIFEKAEESPFTYRDSAKTLALITKLIRNLVESESAAIFDFNWYETS